MRLKPRQLAIEYYFGDLQYWKIPAFAVQALEEGYDGPALRELAWITTPVEAEMNFTQIDAAFREMGVLEAPISRDSARLFLALQLAERVVNRESNVFDAAKHLRTHLCELNQPPDELREIWKLASEAKNAPRGRWAALEKELHKAFSDFLKNHIAGAPGLDSEGIDLSGEWSVGKTRG